MSKDDTDRVFDDFQDALSSEQLSDALRSIKEHLEKKKAANVKANNGGSIASKSG